MGQKFVDPRRFAARATAPDSEGAEAGGALPSPVAEKARVRSEDSGRHAAVQKAVESEPGAVVRACLDTLTPWLESLQTLIGQPVAVTDRLGCPFGAVPRADESQAVLAALADRLTRDGTIEAWADDPGGPAAWAIRVYVSEAYIGNLVAGPVPAEAPSADAERLKRALPFLRETAREIGRRLDAESRAVLRERSRSLAWTTPVAEGPLARAAAQVPIVLYQYKVWPDGRAAFPHATEGLRAIFGLSPDVVRTDARPVMEVLHPDDADRVTDAIRHSARTLGRFEETFRVCHPDRGLLWIEGRAEPTVAADGSILWHGMFLDATERVEQEEALRVLRDQSRVVAQDLRYGTWTLDLRAGLFDVDDRFFEMLGYLPQAFRLTVETWLDLMHPDEAAVVWDMMGRQIARGDTFALEIRFRTGRGDWLWVETRGRVLERRGDRPVRMTGTNVDISARKSLEMALQDSESRFRRLHDQSPVPYVALDRDGRIRDLNAPFRTLMGRASAALIGQKLKTFLAEEDREIGVRCLRALLSEVGEVATHGCDIVFTHPEGQDVTVRLLGRVQRDAGGGFVLLHCVLHDLSERNRLEERLARSNSELAQFAHAVFHDLRGPLRLVTDFLERVEKDLPASATETLDWVAFAMDATGRMNTLVLDLMDVARLGAADHRREAVPLDEAVTEALHPLRSDIGQRGAQVTVARPLPTVPADRRQMVRLFRTLIGAALASVPNERVAEVRVACRSITAQGWVLTVSDNGGGVSGDARAWLATAFQRPGGRRTGDGRELELTLCQRIVDVHDGRIWIEDNQGGGTVFCVMLPSGDRSSLPGSGPGDGGGALRGRPTMRASGR
ncbi:PAS domain-containing protein [Roseospira marina]|uniref:histidine kinase n=1 Tax=Roseospira marina TaxID=140057 RepID=A0A5M6ICM1_9PROT|nr:PAS domain-containing protein [Roseospira marina]KAA5605976.1 PAS domain-containing protein [Roseospira marina]MBB4313175.1 PAS domain S-box-containing protein [Roseospira marina]MBB5086084.1 PAS domain S-box-containing protein [Roseospira marina]